MKDWIPLIVALVALLGTTISPLVAGFFTLNQAAKKLEHERESQFLTLALRQLQDAHRQLRVTELRTHEVLCEIRKHPIEKIPDALRDKFIELGRRDVEIIEGLFYLPPQLNSPLREFLEELEAIGNEIPTGQVLPLAKHLQFEKRITAKRKAFEVAAEQWMKGVWSKTIKVGQV